MSNTHQRELQAVARAQTEVDGYTRLFEGALFSENASLISRAHADAMRAFERLLDAKANWSLVFLQEQCG